MAIILFQQKLHSLVTKLLPPKASNCRRRLFNRLPNEETLRLFLELAILHFPLKYKHTQT